MQQTSDNQASGFRWGVPASVVAHLVVIALLLFEFPIPQPQTEQPEQPEAIAVELVPPTEEMPEEEEPEEIAEEEPAAAPQAGEVPVPEEKPAAEEAAPEEQATEEPPPEEQVAEEEAAPPPELAEQETAEAEPPAQPEQPEQSEQVPPAAGAPDEGGEGQPSAIRPLRPVFAFGEDDAGPRENEEGNAPEDPEEPAEQPVLETETGEAEPDPLAEEDVSEAEADTGEQVLAVETGETDAPSIVVVPDPKPPVDLTEARQLFSRDINESPAATTAIAGMPRATRIGELCATELREQLRHGVPPRRPQLIPAYRLQSGNELVVRNGAFMEDRQWYELSFRCNVDDDATRVISFALDVGAPIPRSEWRERGFPQF